MASDQPLRPFHLAVPVHDLAAARAFYGGVLGCAEGRSAPDWVDFDFFGHQLVCHLDRDTGLLRQADRAQNRVDGHDVPVPHFGVVLTLEQWHALRQRLEAANVTFPVPPHIRFPGLPGEQRTLFIRDPSGNALEFKGFRDLAALFAGGPEGGLTAADDGAARPPLLGGLDHVVLRARDPAGLQAFYQRVLGCREERRVDDLGLVQLRAGDALIDIVAADGELGRRGGGPPDSRRQNLDHFCLRVDPFDEAAIRDWLAACGVDAGATARRYGARGFGPSIYLRDPEGNVVELKGVDR